MGPKPPPPMLKLGPRQMKQLLNDARAYGIATHLSSWLFDQSQNSIINTPGGVLVKLMRRGLFYVELEQSVLGSTPYVVDVSDQLGNSVDPGSPPSYIPTADLTSGKPAGTILGGFFAAAFGDDISMTVKADGNPVSFGGGTTQIVAGEDEYILAADAGQRVSSSLVFEFSSVGGNDQIYLFVWGVMP